MTEEKIFNVYKRDPKNYIAVVEAKTLQKALEKAHRKYGGPIIVEPAPRNQRV